MAREYSRTNRFGEVIMRELALMIQREVSDPRVGMATVSHVDVTADLKYAKVYVTRLNGFESEQDAAECLKGLNSAAGYLRRGLAGRVKLRNIPELQFVYDQSLENGFKMDELIARANASNRQEDD
ncbi:30S ribosome-binding factor RbfA [Methylophaga sp. OBS1]|jgi:ribosome-binding factor A|uniref:30S ribosome-binding factor RbfA n=1 Tax=Methylophaga sp. OBS1 TaxID=2991933 RepID=UPI00225ACFD1|nr:30S ribosome-binding factor RbfA [Methylophaga sp. OBS1]MCX4193203.1 30S ribosome-binding factor RbfA [Methylophaga sp. OBS1]